MPRAAIAGRGHVKRSLRHDPIAVKALAVSAEWAGSGRLWGALMHLDDEYRWEINRAMATGELSYTDAAIAIVRRICAVSNREGYAIGQGDFSLPVLRDLALQPEIRTAHLFGLSRRMRDTLGGAAAQSDEPEALRLHDHALDERIGGTDLVSSDAGPLVFLVLSLSMDNKPVLQDLFGRIEADKPVILIEAHATDAGEGRAWREDIARQLSQHQYAAVGPFGTPVSEETAEDEPPIVWGFPEHWADAGPAMVPLAVAKAAADADAFERPL